MCVIRKQRFSYPHEILINDETNVDNLDTWPFKLSQLSIKPEYSLSSLFKSAIDGKHSQLHHFVSS